MKDWLYVGAEVKTKDGKYYTVLNISENNGVQLDNYKWYCRTELTSVEIKPTKTELIDKAIDDLDGDISTAMYHDWKGHAHLKYSNGYYRLCHYNSSSVVDGLCFCTIEEFEQRKKEREMEKIINNTNWYDYEQQRIISKPPINSKVLYDDYKKGLIEVIILGYHPNPDNDAVWSQAIHSFGDDTNYSTDSVYNFRPLDWDKLSKRKQAITYAMELIPARGSFEEILGLLYDAGVLKLPESSKA